MKIIIKRCNEPCYVAEVEKLELEDMQSMVGGNIELIECNVGSAENPMYVDVWLNEEGKIREMPPNLALVAHGGDKSSGLFEWIDCLHGDLFFAASDSEGNTVGLSEEQITETLMCFGSIGASFFNGKPYFVQNFEVLSCY